MLVFPPRSEANSVTDTAFDRSTFIGGGGDSCLSKRRTTPEFGLKLGGGMSVCHIHSFSPSPDSDHSTESNKA